ncbi:hypothetical protein PR048_010340 [Dryococelus australis]|uniref:Reverse transcriptase domain-containing protein n=1 Tax=Dryococelus australis TaxID=614101 RepID=A0ABQ9I2G5_9NEOP|nr:hypothetical protein PR048_010340 [Dryococelus australis]
MEDAESKHPINLIQDQGFMEQHDDEDIMYSIQEVGLNSEVNQLQAHTKTNRKKLYTALHFPTAVVYQIDSGATCNVMSIQDLQRVTGEADPQLDSSITVLKCYANTQIIPLGQRTLQCTYKGHVYCLTFQIVDLDRTPIIEFKDTLEGLGQIPGEVQLDVKHDAKPQQDPPRRVPVPLKKELKILLQQLEQNSTSAGSNFTNAKDFSLLDTKNGYWQIKLSEKSSKLTTFSTPFGRYRWLRLPFGICSAPEIFQRKLQEALGILPGVEIVADDILVYGQGQTETEARINHDENLLQLFQ